MTENKESRGRGRPPCGLAPNRYVRFDAATDHRITELARHLGVDISALVRRLVAHGFRHEAEIVRETNGTAVLDILRRRGIVRPA